MISKKLLFSDKRRSCKIAFFSVLYSRQWPHKGLRKVYNQFVSFNYEPPISSGTGSFLISEVGRGAYCRRL